MRRALSVLVCSIESRRHFLARLLAGLSYQVGGGCELLIDTDDGDTTIGEKRNRLLDRSAGQYVCFIDDDDAVSDDYVKRILEATKDGADCVGFKVARFLDGEYQGEATHSIHHPEQHEIKVWRQPWVYFRWINHLCPVRRELALETRFRNLSLGEDVDYAERIRPLLKSETQIDRVLYHYLLRSRPTRENERVHPTRWPDPIDVT